MLNKTQRDDLKKLLKPDYRPLKAILTQVTLSSVGLIADPPMDFEQIVVFEFRLKVRKRKTIEVDKSPPDNAEVRQPSDPSFEAYNISKFESPNQEPSEIDLPLVMRRSVAHSHREGSGKPDRFRIKTLTFTIVLHIMAALGRTKYGSHYLEAQIQLQFMDATEAFSHIDNLQKDLEVSNTELAQANSITEGLKKDLAVSQQLFEAREKEKAETERKVVAEVELIRIAARRDQNAAMKMGRKLMGRGYNICVKKLLKLLPIFIPENLDQVDLTLQELEEDEEEDEEEGIPLTF
ncbi:hypothetical protein F0562_003009 [Nyssa sinensis]|uniref:Uncharacterized protein n=1 Tax=Nyssa sinensis TaxID=561372 RepID=A0A5J5BXB5_9ASTE|nr:hypothetical protein F0562_003009 [Nyssa sinensis]